MSHFAIKYISGCPCSFSPLLILTVEGDDLVTEVQGCVPRHYNGILYALMSGATLGMNSERSFGGITEFRWDSEIIMNCDGLDTNGFADADDAAIDGCGVCFAVIRNLAP
jgi:hypothetical protein